MVPLNPSVDASHRKVGSPFMGILWCAALLWLPSVFGQSAAIAPARETRSSAPVALRASARANGSEARPSDSGEPRGEEIEVQPGDTASEIAVVRLPAEVSLDQMLVALLRRNPEVFGGGNVNRLPAGAVLKIPDARMAAAIPLAEARRIIAEQAREYEAFRAAQADRFRTPLNGRSNRVEVLAQPVQTEALRPRKTEDELTWKAPGELTHGGISEKLVASTVPPSIAALVEPATPALEPSPPLSTESPQSAPVVAADRTPTSEFFGGWLWVLGIAALAVAVAWRWFRAVKKLSRRSLRNGQTLPKRLFQNQNRNLIQCGNLIQYGNPIRCRSLWWKHRPCLGPSPSHRNRLPIRRRPRPFLSHHLAC